MSATSKFLEGDLADLVAKEFPQMQRLCYLDAAATHPVALSVRQSAAKRALEVHASPRGGYSLGHKAQEELEGSRERIAAFFGKPPQELAFSAGATTALNYVFLALQASDNDVLFIPESGHSSTIITARNIARETRTPYEWVEIDKEGRLDLTSLESLRKRYHNSRIILPIVHASNVSGVIHPINEIREILGEQAVIILDAAQSAGRMPIDFSTLHVEYACVSAHKMGGGNIGGLFYSKRGAELLRPIISGGGSVKLFSRKGAIYREPPQRFEPGTPNVSGAVLWSHALDFLSQIGLENIRDHERAIGHRLYEGISSLDGFQMYGSTCFDEDRTGIVTWNFGSYLKMNYQRVGRYLEENEIQARVGCFCAFVEMEKLMRKRSSWDKLPLSEYSNAGRSTMMRLGVGREIIERPGAVRFAPWIGSTKEKVDYVLDVLGQMEDESLGATLSGIFPFGRKK